MQAMPGKERYPALVTAALRELAPVVTVSALTAWFDGLSRGSDYPVPAGSRPVRNASGRQLGRATLRRYSSTAAPYYTNTVSVNFRPDDGRGGLVVRGRERAVSSSMADAGRRWPPELVDVNFLEEINGDTYPLAWREGLFGALDLIPGGAHFSSVHEPAIASVQQEGPVNIAEVEARLLEFGGLLLSSAGIGQQDRLFE